MPSGDYNGTQSLDELVFNHLGLGSDYEPNPSSDPIAFLQKHLTQLPQSILLRFSTIINPKDRTIVSAIRNRRYKYTSSKPQELTGEHARDTWKELWQGPSEDTMARIRRLQAQANSDERSWAETNFLGGQKQHVGKLGGLLGKVSVSTSVQCNSADPQSPGDYAEERAAESLRKDRRLVHVDEFIPEEETDSEEEESSGNAAREDTFDELKDSFERTLRERLIYGLLDVSVTVTSILLLA